MKTFAEGVEELILWTGTDLTIGHVVVDQVYAHSQHEDISLVVLPHKVETIPFVHRHGGGAGYLRDPLYANLVKYMEELALGVLPNPLGDTNEAMFRCMQDLAGDGGVRTHAPRFDGILMNSGHAFVTDEFGAVIHDKPPLAPRMTTPEENLLWTEPNGDWKWD
jgi:hypothetical protein